MKSLFKVTHESVAELEVAVLRIKVGLPAGGDCEGGAEACP